MSTRPWAYILLMASFFCASAFMASCGGDDDDDSGDGTDDDSIDDDADDDADDDSGESVWTDDITGLGWQNGPEVGKDSMDFSTANAYCQDLVWAGFDDWRLPTISELRSLVRGCDDTVTGGSCQVRDNCTSRGCWNLRSACAEAEGPGPGGAYWSDEVDGHLETYWSSTPIAGEAGQYWPINFRFGAVYADLVPVYQTRCVRGDESGVTDDTGEAYSVGYAVMANLDFEPIVDARCELTALDGEDPDEPMVVTSGNNGFCLMVFNHHNDTFSMKITKSGYRDMYVSKLPTLPFDESYNAVVWGDILLDDDALAERTGPVGVTQDPSKGIVWGTAHWLKSADVFDPGYDAMVGCATFAPDTNLYYTDGNAIPTTDRTMTSPDIAGWYAFNVEPGAVEYTATVDGHSESTGEATVYPNALTIVMSVFRDSEYPENPMPDGCL